MKRSILTLILICSVLFGTHTHAADTLDQGFLNPPDSAKPQVWWHWMNGNVTKEGITADLEAMQRAGIGGAQIFNVNQRIASGPVLFNSPEWQEMVRYAAAEARRLGLELSIHNCAGWSSSGGPWNTPANSMKTVVTSEKQIQGPSRFEDQLAQPPTRLEFYRDIAVLAFRTPDEKYIPMRSVSPKVTVNAKNQDAAKTADGKANTFIQLDTPAPDAPQYIQLEFARPYEARMLLITPGPGKPGTSGSIEVSDDGQVFRAIGTFSMAGADKVQNFTFASVSARFYRVLFTATENRVLAAAQKNKPAIAEIEFSPKAGINNLAGKTFGYRGGDMKATTCNTMITPEAAVQSSQIIDLTSQMKADGQLVWDVPDGDWTVLRVGYTSIGTKNHPATAEAEGLECDKLSKEAVQAHWDGCMGKLLTALGPLAGRVESGLNGVLIDSDEVGTENWTPDFKKEFRSRCGYDLTRFLPVFAGRMVDSPEITERFLRDFRRTVADLFAENYSGQFAAMAHRAGLKYSVEPYGNGSFDDLQYGSYADIPMDEFWLHSNKGGGGKRASSIGHVYGKPIIGAEAFTAAPENDRWSNDPYALKAIGDRAWCKGINRFIIHSFAMQPWTDPARCPGMTMGRFGTHFNRSLTWWEQSRAWLKYIARSQYLLQQGRFAADVCFYSGEKTPMGMPDIQLPPGYDGDACHADALKLMTVKNGCIMLPSGMSYRVLVLPDEKTMSLPVLRKIGELVKAGATVTGPKPEKAPGLTGYPACDREVKQLADEIWARGVSGRPVEETLARLNIKPDFEFTSDSAAQLSYIHRLAGDADIYFVSNQRDRFDAAECTFRVSGKVPELWHPDTGVIEKVPVWREENGRITVPLQFDLAGSVFVVFRQASAADHAETVRGGTAGQGEVPDEKLTVLKAEYGAFGQTADQKRIDVTAKVAALVKNGTLTVTGNNKLAGRDPAPRVVKELRVEYRYKGQRQEARVNENKILTLPEMSESVLPQTPAYVLVAGTDGAMKIQAWDPVAVELKTAAGKVIKAAIADVPPPVEIAGPWKLDFPPNWGAPATVTLDKLISWTEHADRGVKYFSGTAAYTKDIDLPAELFGDGKSLRLDLGAVKNIAEVFVNGKPLGILWKPPFCVDISAAAKPGTNKLEIRITNLWPNRLIGDEQLPPDCEWDDSNTLGRNALTKWPQWMLDGKPSPSGRLTFSTWHHWKKDDALLPSGLLGPVTVQPAVQMDVK